MEYVKSALSVCCKNCCFKRKESDSSTQIIVPTSRKGTTKRGTLASRNTFTYLPQPDFYIPLSEDKPVTTTMSPITKRKQSAPPVMTRTIAIQPISAYTSREMHKSWGEPQIRIDEDEDCDNVNNNSLTLDAGWKSTESVNSLSPTHRPLSSLGLHRLSVAQIAASHSRRSSMCSFDISKEDVDSEMYESGDLSQDINSNGKLCFTISYNKQLEQLTVEVISAKNLWNSEQSSVVTESFVKVCTLSGLKRKSAKISTVTRKDTSSPVFDAEIKFDNISSDSLDMLSVKLSVHGGDKQTKKKKLGVVIYQLDNSLLQHKENEEHERIWRHIYSDGTVSIFFSFRKKFRAWPQIVI